MMKNFILLLLAAVMWGSCNDKKTISEIAAVDTPNDTTIVDGIRFLALGDSYTIGQSVATNERWPVQLADKLADSGYNVSDLKIIAKTGWTTSELADGIQSENPQGPYDLVGLLIGVNNQYRRLDTAEYRKEFKSLLDAAIEFGGGDSANVMVISIPDYSVMPFAEKLDTARIAREIDIFNSINLQESMRAEVYYINITPISRLARENENFIANDGLHPSGQMYYQWAKLIYPVSAEILQNNDLELQKP